METSCSSVIYSLHLDKPLEIKVSISGTWYLLHAAHAERKWSIWNSISAYISLNNKPFFHEKKNAVIGLHRAHTFAISASISSTVYVGVRRTLFASAREARDGRPATISPCNDPQMVNFLPIHNRLGLYHMTTDEYMYRYVEIYGYRRDYNARMDNSGAFLIPGLIF